MHKDAGYSELLESSSRHYYLWHTHMQCEKESNQPRRVTSFPERIARPLSTLTPTNRFVLVRREYRRRFVALIVFHERYARPHIGLGCIPASIAGRPKKVTSGDINVNSISNHFFLTEKGQLIIRIQYS